MNDYHFRELYQKSKATLSQGPFVEYFRVGLKIIEILKKDTHTYSMGLIKNQDILEFKLQLTFNSLSFFILQKGYYYLYHCCLCSLQMKSHKKHLIYLFVFKHLYLLTNRKFNFNLALLSNEKQVSLSLVQDCRTQCPPSLTRQYSQLMEWFLSCTTNYIYEVAYVTFVLIMLLT